MALPLPLPPHHLVVLVHGFDGAATDFLNFTKVFMRHRDTHHSRRGRNNTKFASTTEIPSSEEPTSSSSLHLGLEFLPINLSTLTHDGIEKLAIQVYKEILKRESDKNAVHLDRFSIVAHSLGGLVSRYALMYLSDAGFLERVEPRWFVTFATPHLGVRRPQTTAFNVAFQSIAQRVCRTTQELCLEDRDKVLFKMGTQPEFLDCLRLFKRRVLYSNVWNDFQVHYSTASISPKNRYKREGVSHASHPEFPHITRWSIENHTRRAIQGKEEETEFASRDANGHLLRAMLVSLNGSGLEWERFDAVFPTVFSHEQIIFKRSLFAGEDVVRHFASRFVMSEEEGYGTAQEKQKVAEEVVAAAVSMM